VAQQITIDIVADVQKLKQGVDQANKQLGGLDASAKKVQSLTTAFAGVAVAAKGFSIAGGFINEATDAASNMEETISKTNVLFGESADKLFVFAEAAAKGLGQSKQQALDAATTFATFGKAAGIAGDDLVDFSADFVGLASDLASFNNTSPEQAINAIGSALRGESEPLRSFGVLLNDATLKNAALELGLISTTKNALTPQQKVLAAQKVIYEQTTAAQGDFTRTSDGLANAQRILEAEQANLNANIGQTFLPIMKIVNDVMLKAVSVFTALPSPIQKGVVVFGLFIGVIAPTIILVSSLKTAMLTLTASTVAQTTATGAATTATKLFRIALASTGIGLLIVAIGTLIANFDKVKTTVSKLVDYLSNAFNGAKEAIGRVIQRIKDLIPDWLKKLLGIDGQSVTVSVQGGSGINKGLNTVSSSSLPFGGNIKTGSNAQTKEKVVIPTITETGKTLKETANALDKASKSNANAVERTVASIQELATSFRQKEAFEEAQAKRTTEDLIGLAQSIRERESRGDTYNINLQTLQPTQAAGKAIVESIKEFADRGGDFFRATQLVR
jgi:hypothetical protein